MTCMSVDILVNREERSVISEDWSDSSMSFRVVSITGCPMVGKEAMEDCKAWFDWKGLKAWASICAGGGGSIRMQAFAGLPVMGLSPALCLGGEGAQ